MKQFTTYLTGYDAKRGHGASIRVSLPKKVVAEFGLEIGDILLVQPDKERGVITLVPAKVVPRNLLRGIAV
jgi:bifunctional DNA-binding transcriptional regulator/antitoxin component of YhaV-PrlF toxin-antitoxin module